MAEDVNDEAHAPAGIAPPADDQVLVAAGDDEPEVDHDESVQHPTRLLRIAAMTRTTLDEVRRDGLDEAARGRLASIHNTSVAALRDVVSDDLRQELDEVGVDGVDEDQPSEPELRLAHAQLAGWLDGLFHGIQASVTTQQMAAKQQVEQTRRRALGQGKAGGPNGSGQYL